MNTAGEVEREIRMYPKAALVRALSLLAVNVPFVRGVILDNLRRLAAMEAVATLVSVRPQMDRLRGRLDRMKTATAARRKRVAEWNRLVARHNGAQRIYDEVAKRRPDIHRELCEMIEEAKGRKES